MRLKTSVIFGFATLLLAGCETVHTSREDAVPVAAWSSLILTDPQGHIAKPSARDIVRTVLVDAGLHPVVDDAGVAVPDSEETKAREVLLTDQRLADTDVLVFLAVPAGTGRKTPTGFEVPAIAPPSE